MQRLHCHIKTFNSFTKDMDAKEFNELLKLHIYDKDAKYRLCCFCLAVIKKRLMFRNEYDNTESLAHSILEYFLSHIPVKYVGAPCRYLYRCTDNFLSNLKKKKKRSARLITDISYEQQFTQLEKFEIYRILKQSLGEPNAQIIYLRYVDEEKEYDIAKKLNISYDAVRQRISRSLNKLKSIIKDVTKEDL